MAGDVEKARREMRWAKSAADDRRWDQLEPKIQAIEEALKNVPDAEAAPVLAELQPLKEKLVNGVREEKAGRIEREIRRNLSAAADDLNRGYAESPQLPKTIARLESAEAREVLSADVIAKLQAEIAVLQAKSGGKAPPPPPPPPTPPAADHAQAKRIEDDVARSLRMVAEDVSRFPERAEPPLARAAATLDSPEAKQNLSPESMQRLRAQAAELRSKLDAARKAEKAVAIEREIKRSMAAAADELDRGYAESPQLLKAITRLNSPEAREVLPADLVAKLEAGIAPLQAKSTVKAPPPPPPTPAATPPPPPAAKAAPAAGLSDDARRILGDLERTLKFGLDELGRNPLQCDNYVGKLNTRLDSDDAKQHLPAGTLQRLRAQVDEFQAKVETAKREDEARTLEDFIGRFVRNAESDLSHNRRQAEQHLARGLERIEKDDVKQLLSAGTVATFRSEFARIQGLVAAAAKKDGLDRAHPILRQLEERVSGPVFDGSQQPWQVLGDLDSLKSRVRGALSEVPKDDADVKAIEARIAKVDGIIAGQTAKLGRDQAHARIAQIWDIEQKAVAGWEEESPGDAEAPTYDLPKTALAVRRLTWFQNDADVKTIGSEYTSDREIQSMIEQARAAREAAVAKLHAAFTAHAAFMERQPRPSNRIDLEAPSRLAGRAGSDFEGTPHKDAAVARAKGLYDRWQAEIEADRKARQAKYDELSVAAAREWPRILSTIRAEDGFDPQDSGAKGRTVLIKELRNRIGWDFSGRYDFAIWVGETPVVGNYDKTVAAAVDEACEKAGLPLDDHTDWDAVIVVGGPGKIKQRFNVVVRDRNNLELGSIEEWRPVDCVMCTVIALRAGPAAVGPKG